MYPSHDAAQLSNDMRMVSVTNSICPMHFTFQFGLLKEHIQVTRNNFSLNELKELAATTVSKQVLTVFNTLCFFTLQNFLKIKH